MCGACWEIYLTRIAALFAAELMMAEAVGLVNTLDNWRVVDKIILSTKTPEKKRIFGKGNFQSLTGVYPFCVSTCESVSRCVCVRPHTAHLCFFSPFRENQANSRNHCCVCECWAPVSFIWGELIWKSLSGCIQTVSCTDGHFFHPYRGSWRKPGGLRSLTDTQWSFTSSVAMPGLKKPSYRSLWQRSPC